MRSFHLIIWSVLAALLLPGPGLGSETPPEPASEPEFRIITEQFPPYNYTDDQGRLVGISTEIVQEMLTRLGRVQTIEVLPWEKGYGLARSEENIILFSTTRSPIREDLFKWVGPLVPNNLVLFAKKGSGITIGSLEEAKKAGRIGVYKDDFGELFLKEKGFENLVSEPENSLNVPKLISGEIDLWVANELTGRHLAARAGVLDKVEKVFGLTENYMYLAFSRSTPDPVIRRWQKVLNEIKSDGTYAQIFSNWVMFSYTSDLRPEQVKAVDLTKEEQAWIKAHPVIRVAPDPDYAPFQYRDLNGNSRGLANDYLELIQRKLGLRFEFIPSATWAESLKAVEERKADLVLVAARNEDRERYMLFTPPYVGFPDMIVTHKNNPVIDSIVQLQGKTLATVRGFAINDYINKYYPKIKLAYKPDVDSIVKSVSMGESYATVLNIATVSHAIEKTNITNLRVDGDTGFTYHLAFASRHDWPVLNSLLEKGLRAVSDRERKDLLRKWIFIAYQGGGSDRADPTVPLTDEEREWLKQHPVITLAPDPNWAPVEFFDDQGRYSGMTADYVALLEKRLGLKFHVLRMSSWEQVIQDALEGRIDVLPGVVKTPKRTERLLFTDNYLSLPSVIIVNKKETEPVTMADLRGKRVAVVAGYAIQEYLERNHPHIHLDFVSSPEEGLRQVSFGHTYAFIGSLATTSHIIEKEMLTNLHVAGQAEYSWELSFSTHRTAPLLRRILNKGLASITKEERQAIFAKWILVRKEGWSPTREQIIGFLVAVASLLVIGVFIWNRMLVREVDLRTAELREAKSQAEAAANAKSEFLAAITHELRTPLTTVLGAAQVMEQAGTDGHDPRLLSDLKNAGQYLGALIDNVLNLSSIEQGKVEIVNRPFALPPLLEEAVAMLKPRAREKGLELTYRGRDLPEYISADPVGLRQIVTNLLNNAIKYTAEGRVGLEVELESSTPGRGVLLAAVSDTGPGIPDKQRETIFMPFEQAAQGGDHRRGFGLGLAICRRLVEAMGGTMGLESEPGSGSRFWFTLPFNLASAEAAVPDEKRFGPRKILLVEDDRVNLGILTSLLENDDHQVVAVDNGWAASEAVDREGFDLVLMDVRMPGLDGFETTALIRGQPGRGIDELPIYALTAMVSQDVVARCREAGMNGVIAKPLRLADLDATLAGDLGDRRQPAEADEPFADLIDRTLQEEYSRSLSPEDLAEWRRRQHHSLEEEEAVLDAAWAKRDLAATAAAAHKIAGSAAMAGFPAWSRRALLIEEAARDKAVKTIPALLKALQKTKAATIKASGTTGSS